MKILQVVYSLSSGGAEKFVVNLSNELASRGHDVMLLQLLDDTAYPGLSFNRRFLSDAVKYVNVGLASGFSLSKVRKVSRIVKSICPDVVHGHLNVMPYFFPLLVRKNSGIRFIHTLHSVAHKSSGLKIQKGLNRWMYSSVRIRPVTISEQCRSGFQSFYKLNNNPSLIENGTYAVSQSLDIEKVRAEIGALKNSDKTKVYIHVARFHEAKNQQLLIDAFNRMYGSGRDAILLVLGSGYDTTEASDLIKMACPAIHFIGVKSNVGDYLLCSDVFCLSSNYEGLPISLLEAMSAGLTSVCTPVGGIPDVVSDGITGYLAKEHTIESYAETLERASDAPLNSELIMRAFERRFSITTCADAYIKLYAN